MTPLRCWWRHDWYQVGMPWRERDKRYPDAVWELIRLRCRRCGATNVMAEDEFYWGGRAEELR